MFAIERSYKHRIFTFYRLTELFFFDLSEIVSINEMNIISHCDSNNIMTLLISTTTLVLKEGPGGSMS